MAKSVVLNIKEILAKINLVQLRVIPSIWYLLALKVLFGIYFIHFLVH
jgi:hypothetical protein